MIWFVLGACLVVSFTFSGIESGVLAVNRVRLRHHALRGEEAALQLDALLMRLERLMITVALVTNAANVLAVALLYGQFSRWLSPVWAAVLSLVVLLPVFVLVLELLPKVIFRRFPYRTLAVFARILTVTHWVLGPLVSAGAWVLRPVFTNRREPKRDGLVSVEGLKTVVRAGADRGDLSGSQRDFIGNALDFRFARVRDVMIPLEGMRSLPGDTPVADALTLAAESGADRFPVMGEDGTVVGILRVFDLLRDNVRSGRVRSYVRRAVTVAPDARALEALRKLRAARMQLGIAVDVNGRPVGTVQTDVLVRRLLLGAPGPGFSPG